METQKSSHELGLITRFLSYDSLMDGINIIMKSSMGLMLNRVPTEKGEVWDPSVERFDLCP